MHRRFASFVVFSTKNYPPSKYCPGSTLLNFGNRTKTGVFIVILPQIKNANMYGKYGNLKESNHNDWNLILLTITTVVNMILAGCPVIVALRQTECGSSACANV